MIGDDGAVSLRIVERRPVLAAARYAFNLARKTGKRVTSSSKYTIQREITLGQCLKRSTLDLLREGVRTRDLGGRESTESFTEAVAAEVVRRLDSGDHGRSKSPGGRSDPRSVG